MSYVCAHCLAESRNPNDLKNLYCGRCHRFADGDTAEEREAKLNADLDWMLRRYPAEHVLAVLRKFGQEITDPDEIARIERMFAGRKNRLH